MKNPYRISTPVKSVSMSRPENQSAGILDDYSVRKNVATKEGTIEKVPVNPSDIVNKAYADTKVDGSGVANTIPLWSDSNTLTNSFLTQANDKVVTSVTIHPKTYGSLSGLDLGTYELQFRDAYIQYNAYIGGNIYGDGGGQVTVEQCEAAYDHVSNNGSDHSYINQSVVSGSTPTFGDIKGETKCIDFTIINPAGAYTVEPRVFIMRAKSPLTFTKITAQCGTTGYEVLGDLKKCNSFITRAGSAVMNDFDTTSGYRTDNSLTAGTVAADRCVYLSFDSTPNAALTQVHYHLEWDYD
jgi:hypothetical protein